ncbi:MAG: signal peptidase I [Chloroflexi bacterium HGW-Chloroflexi-3]|nr:MAG: signal peptidase I [Chloroflexi bacterium HGW-Chloroflexi-3]
MKFRSQKLFWLIFAIIAFISFWVTFAPRQIGGKVSYIIIRGSSMEPAYHQGDLVLLRERQTYLINDIAAYRHPDIGLVIHRLVNDDGTHFTFKGDNNTWLDDYSPTQDEIIGKEWLYFSGVGKIVEFLQTPWGLLILIGVILMLLVDWFPKKNRETKQPQTVHRLPAALQTLETIFILAGVSLALLSFTRPTTVDAVNKQAFQHVGIFSYSAPAPEGIYDQPRVETGAPIFNAVTCNLQIGFQYNLMSTLPIKQVNGTYTLRAFLKDDIGWTRTILKQEGLFASTAFETSTPLDICAARDMLASIVEQTGARRPRYALVIQMDIHAQGMLADQSFDDTYSPQMYFTMTDNELYLEKGMVDSLQQAGYVTSSSQVENLFSLLGLTLPVSLLRTLALALAALGLMMIVVRTLILPRFIKKEDVVEARAESISFLVQSLPNVQSDQVIEILHLDNLLEISHQLNMPLLEYRGGSETILFVRTADSLYRHTSQEDTHE